NFPDIGRVEGFPGCSGMSANAPALANLESRAFQTEFAGPPCRDHKLVGVIVFQQHRQTVVSKRIGNVSDDLIKKCFEVEYGVDLLRDALKQKQLLDSQELIQVVERSCRARGVYHRLTTLRLLHVCSRPGRLPRRESCTQTFKIAASH